MNCSPSSVDLTEIDHRATDVLTNPNLLEAFRYFAGPPLSADDLKTLSEGVLSPARLRKDRRIVELASAALMATRSVGTARRQEGKEAQELLVADALSGAGMKRVDSRLIPTLNLAPSAGEFCRESVLGSRKADIVVRLWDHRLMPIECKVSNSALNSIKRVNNDAAVKAETWTKDFGTRNIVPAAVIGGVYKLRHLSDAQQRGLTLFWGHDLLALVSWIEQAR